MKYLLSSIFIFFFSSAYAGGYYNPTIDTYDSVTGFYYKSVESKKKSGFLSGGKPMVNLYIYDPKTSKGKSVFPIKSSFQIISLAFETKVEGGKVHFHSDYAAPIKNNQNISPREPKSNILIVTRDTESERETFYVAKKDGTDLKPLKTISATDNWHIDVKNDVIRVVRQTGHDIKIESFRW